MCPHRIHALPSSASLSQYNISENGFLPSDPPLSRLPNDYYEPWELIVKQLPELIEKQQIRAYVDAMPILTTTHLDGESHWQRAYSILAIIAQGYIWTGPEPSEASIDVAPDDLRADYLRSVFRLASLSRSSRLPRNLK